MSRQKIDLKERTRATVALNQRTRETVEGTFPQINQAPSVIVIIMDDVGQDQLNFYDDTNEWAGARTAPYNYPLTPWMDSIAAAGIVYDYCYASPLCSPTRAQFLTGRYPHIHSGHNGTGIGTLVQTGATTKLEADTYPLPFVLQARGDTPKAAFGKWHLGAGNADKTAPIRDGGFDLYKGSITNPNTENLEDPPFGDGGDYTNYWKTIADADGATQAYSTGVFMGTDEVQDMETWIGEQTGPFFLYYACHSVHSSGEREEGESEVIDSISNTASPTGGRLTATFDEAAQEAGTAIAHIPWRRTNAHIESIDAVGGLIAAAIPTTISNNLTWFILGDNGTPTYVVETEDDNYFGNTEEPPAGAYDTTHFKGRAYEQGVRVPLVIGGTSIPTGYQGTHSVQLVDVVDLYPTILDIFDPFWRSYANTEGFLSDIDGVTLKNTFGGSASDRAYTFAQSFTPNGVQVGSETTYQYGVTNVNRWKLHLEGGLAIPRVEELYYLGDGEDYSSSFTADPTEQTDLMDKIVPGANFDINAWREYAGLATYLINQLLSDPGDGSVPGAVFSTAPPYTAIAISDSLAPLGTIHWAKPGSKPDPTLRSAIGHGSALVMDTGRGIGQHHVSGYLSSASNPPTATFTDTFVFNFLDSKTFTLVDVSRNTARGAAMTIVDPVGNSIWRPEVKYFTTGSSSAVWSWNGPDGADWRTADIRMTDDGATIVLVYSTASPAETRIVRWAVGSSTPTSNVSAVFSYGVLEQTGISGDGAIAAGLLGTKWSVWNTTTGASKYVGLSGDGPFQVKPSLSSDGAVVVYGSTTNMRVFEAGAGTYSKTFDYQPIGTGSQMTHTIVSNDGSTAFAVWINYGSGTTFYQVGAVDVASQTELFQRSLPFISQPSDGVVEISCNTDGTKLVIGMMGANDTEYKSLLIRYKAGVWRNTENLYELTGPADSARISPDGLLASITNSDTFATVNNGETALITLPL